MENPLFKRITGFAAVGFTAVLGIFLQIEFLYNFNGYFFHL
jgi:hypothetical protein